MHTEFPAKCYNNGRKFEYTIKELGENEEL